MELKQERLDRINVMLEEKVPKAEIARKMKISRTRLYTILAEQAARES